MDEDLDEPNNAVVGKYRKATSKDSFATEVRRWFGPLATRWGMSDPVDDDRVIPTITYRLGALSYQWMHDTHEYGIDGYVTLDSTDVRRDMSLGDLVVAAGLGAPQHVRKTAKTWRALQQAIESQTQWLDRLHPRLTGPEAPAFLDAAGARRSPLVQPK